MEVALGLATSLLGKVLTTLSDRLVAAYVDSLQLGHNSDQIRDKLLHTQGLLHNAQGQGSHVGHKPGLQPLLEKLSRDADQAEDLLDEVHYFQIHDKLHGTNYATTQEAGHDLDSLVRHQALHAGSALRHTLSSLVQCFSCSPTPKRNGGAEYDAAVLAGAPRRVTNTLGTLLHCFSCSCTPKSKRNGDDAAPAAAVAGVGGDASVVAAVAGVGGDASAACVAGVTNSNSASPDDGDALHFDRVSMSREIKSVLQGMQSHCDSVSNLLSTIPSSSTTIVLKRPQTASMIIQDRLYGRTDTFEETVNRITTVTGLEPNDFLTFFEACVFDEGDKPEHYEDEFAGIARRIANKLKGSPLAAKTVGRLLQKDLSQVHWNGVLEKHQWLKQQDDDDIMQSLKISYDFLPFYLQKCFSYCGLFPEDHKFTSSEITHFWAAIGIIDSNHQANSDYLEELVDNGFLMKKFGWHENEQGPYYVMHDLMHELSRSVSAQECLNISGLDFRADAIPQSVRHLSIDIEDRYDANFEEEMCKLRERIDIANLRTLMIFKRYEERITKILEDSFKEINSLRVLFIVVKSAQSFPYRFSKLIHLQYLKISSPYGDHEMSLPSTLSRFYHLKFLDLDCWCGRSDLPEDFSHLENLHDFHARSKLHSNIRNVGKMKHLQELKEFHVRKGSMGFELTELGALTQLEGGLIIHGLEHVATKEEATAAKLMLKRNLKELGLLWGRDRPTTDADIPDALQPHSKLRVLTIANHGGDVGPSWLCLDIWLTSLETLTLEGVYWRTLPPFAKLPNLKVLALRRIYGMLQFGPCCGGASGKCFMRLKEVQFYDMPELVEWVVEPNCCSFASLEKIECTDCPNLRMLPFSEACCTNLRRFKVSGCPRMSLPSMPHTSTLTDLFVETSYSETLFSYDGKRLAVTGYGGALASHNLDKVEDMDIANTSRISLSDIEKLKSLTELTVGRCDGLFPQELDGSIVLRSVKSLTLDVSHLTSSKSSSSKVLNCFPALSVLEIVEDGNHDYEECVMQLPSSSSLQKLTLSHCKCLVLVPVEKENGGGIQEDKSLLQSLTISDCGKLFSRWPMGMGESETSCPFPASLRKLVVEEEPSMKSMALLSNLTSLTTLRLEVCTNLTVDGFNPLIAVNLKELQVRWCNTSTLAADLLSEVAELLPAESYISRLELLVVEDISGLLVAPICNLLAPALHTLEVCSESEATTVVCIFGLIITDPAAKPEEQKLHAKLQMQQTGRFKGSTATTKPLIRS
ncbi:hypothetical protein ZWY2020_047569 [Hordeum vulgare]|nr:hypothetical protein ZWY2020_047569 [Hordeum vulgare]